MAPSDDSSSSSSQWSIREVKVTVAQGNKCAGKTVTGTFVGPPLPVPSTTASITVEAIDTPADEET
jgi:hypothetical protein